MQLRPYQSDLINGSRDILRSNNSVLIQLATGGGKSLIFSKITESAWSKKNRVWIIVPRNELLRQSSDTLFNIGVTHGIISAKSNESRAYHVHVISKDTLIRRYDKIKNWPDLVIFDECHLFLDRQIEIMDIINQARAKQGKKPCKQIGVTATPERLDGRGLKRCPAISHINKYYSCPLIKFVNDRGDEKPIPNGLYDDIVYGPTIQDLIEMGFLSNMTYFLPPIDGLEDLHRRGTEFDADELEALLKKRKVYGKAIDHYKEYADKKACLVFCRSVKAAEETAQKFRESGYLFECIDGKMSYNKRKELISALRDGRIHGLTSCDLITYGLDVPRVECIIMLRPTLSRTLFFQMIGRGLRIFEGKEKCIILDHVGNGAPEKHGHPLVARNWHFFGVEKTTKLQGKVKQSMKLCPNCFVYYEGTKCDNCGSSHVPVSQEVNTVEIDGRLVEVKDPVKFNDRPPEERREYVDRINRAVYAFNNVDGGEINSGAIGELLECAKQLGRQPMWVYWKLSEGMRAVNFPVLHEISRQMGYKVGWARFKEKEILGRL